MSTSVLSGYTEICQTPFLNPFVRAKSFLFRRLAERRVGRGSMRTASAARTLTDLRWWLVGSALAMAYLNAHQHEPAVKGPRGQLCGSQKRTSFWTSACDLNGSTISKSVFWFEMKTDIGQCVFKAFHRDPSTDRHDRKFAVQQEMRLFARASYFNHGGAQVSNCHKT